MRVRVRVRVCVCVCVTLCVCWFVCAAVCACVRVSAHMLAGIASQVSEAARLPPTHHKEQVGLGIRRSLGAHTIGLSAAAHACGVHE